MIKDINRTIHEPARQLLMIYLYSADKVDFTYLKKESGMTQGNLSSHLNKLENEGYIRAEKQFLNKRPLTIFMITDLGRSAFQEYVNDMHLYFNDLKRLVK